MSLPLNTKEVFLLKISKALGSGSLYWSPHLSPAWWSKNSWEWHDSCSTATQKNLLRYPVRHMELRGANIWLKRSSMNYAVSFLYLTHKKLIRRETSLIQKGNSSILPNHSPRINALAKTAPLPPSNTCRSRDLACDCDTNQCLVPHVGSMEIL